MNSFPTGDDLRPLEALVCRALDERNLSDLDVVGFGEISIAIAWPPEKPEYVCKRTPPVSPAEFQAYAGLVDTYVERLTSAGISTLPTSTVAVERDDLLVGYLVQNLQSPDTLADNVLKGSEPSSDHPLLLAVADALTKVTPSLSVDCQFSNWTWDGSTLRLLDVGTPMLWDANGTFELDTTSFLNLLPRPVRPLMRKEMTDIASKWRTPRGAAVDVAASLYRLDLEHWMEAVLNAVNPVIDGSPIEPAEARALYEDDLKTWPRIKRLQQVQRAWQTRVRRQRYEFFIQNSYSGEII